MERRSRKQCMVITFVIMMLLAMSLAGCLGGGGEAEPAAFKVQGVKDGGTYGRLVKPMVIPAEGSTIKELSLNDKPFSNGDTVVASGTYTLRIVVENAKGKTVVDNLEFKLDMLTFGINAGLQGFGKGISDVSLSPNTYKDFTLKWGSSSSIKLTPEEPVNEKPRLIIQPSHEDWVTDWTPYDTISVWIYFDDLTDMDQSGIRIGVSNKRTDDYYAPANNVLSNQDLVVGWNNLQVNLEELLVFESDWDFEEYGISVGDIIDRRGELENFTSSLFIEVDSPEPFYISDIQLLKK